MWRVNPPKLNRGESSGQRFTAQHNKKVAQVAGIWSLKRKKNKSNQNMFGYFHTLILARRSCTDYYHYSNASGLDAFGKRKKQTKKRSYLPSKNVGDWHCACKKGKRKNSPGRSCWCNYSVNFEGRAERITTVRCVYRAPLARSHRCHPLHYRVPSSTANNRGDRSLWTRILIVV